MNDKKQAYNIPIPIIDKKELKMIESLSDQYEKLTKPSKLARIGKQASNLVPKSLKSLGAGALKNISEQDLYQNCLAIIATGFKTLEEQVSRFTIRENDIIKKLNKVSKSNTITELDEVCLMRSYEISKIVNSSKSKNRISALIEGGATGVFGFAGIAPNLVLSLLIYFRAVQAIAMYYGFDIKNDSAEMIIASEVFTSAMSPAKDSVNNEMNNIISKVMVLTESSIVKQTAKKTWTDMASRGGIPLLITQMRALANKAAEKALEKAGQKGLEESLFKEFFEQLGKKLTLDAVEKGVPVVSGLISAIIDYSLMNKIVSFADIFYHKRFLLEKESRLAILTQEDLIVDSNH